MTEIKIDTRERFIPIGRQNIVKDLLAASHWNNEERQKFQEFCKIFITLYHYKFHQYSETLKHYYTPFNPDNDIIVQQHNDEDQKQILQQLSNETVKLLNNGNYEVLDKSALTAAISADSYYGLNVYVDFDDFDQLVVYYRGSSIMEEYKRTWTSLFFKKKKIEIPIYKRVFLLLKFKTEDERIKELVASGETEKRARKLVKKSRKNLPPEFSEKHIFLKLFKNLPRSDLEMLFPNQQVRLKLVDKIKFALTGGGGTIFGIFKAIVGLGNPITFIAAFIGLIGIIFRQIMDIFNQHTRYMMTLSRNLYFHTLNNNFGVIHNLIDIAEEEEAKEVFLAYYFLYTQSDRNHTQASLDREIEQYLKDKYQVDIDFEVSDGIRKLREEGILKHKEDGVLKVVDLKQACVCMDEKWDNFFNF
jgi:ribosomal protein S18